MFNQTTINQLDLDLPVPEGFDDDLVRDAALSIYGIEELALKYSIPVVLLERVLAERAFQRKVMEENAKMADSGDLSKVQSTDIYIKDGLPALQRKLNDPHTSADEVVKILNHLAKTGGLEAKPVQQAPQMANMPTIVFNLMTPTVQPLRALNAELVINGD